MITHIIAIIALGLYLYSIFVLFTFRTHKQCHGYTLFKLGKFQVELWICPPNFDCELHKHANIHSTLWFIEGGGTTIRRINLDTNKTEERCICFPKYWLRRFYLAPNQYHGFNVGGNKLIFLNFQRWTTSNVSSASIDYQPLQPDLPNLLAKD